MTIEYHHYILSGGNKPVLTVGTAMQFIPEEITDRLENEWRQITKPSTEPLRTADQAAHPSDYIRKMAAMAIAHSDRKRL